MRCAIHPSREAVGVCVICGAGVCSKCRYIQAGVTYCQTCRNANRIQEHSPRLLEPLEGPAKPGRFMSSPSARLFILGIAGMILIAVSSVLTFVVYLKQYFGIGTGLNESTLRLLGVLNILDFVTSTLLGVGIVFGGLAFFGFWRCYRSRLALATAIFSFVAAPWPLLPRFLDVLGLGWTVESSYPPYYTLAPGPFYLQSAVLSIVAVCLVGVAFALWSVAAIANSFRAEHQLILLSAGVLLGIAGVQVLSGLSYASFLFLSLPSYYYLSFSSVTGQWLFPAVLLLSVALRFAHTSN